MSSEESKRIEASGGKMASWAFGDIIGYYLSTAYATFIFFFYEVEVGLAVIYVALGLVIFAIWNALNDPLVGYLTDKPFNWAKKYGMRFPWIMIGVFPTLLCYFLLYTPPETADFFAIFLYMVITLCLFDFFFSLYSVHFYGSFTMQFRSDEERRKASAYTNIIPGIGVLFISLVPPMFIVFGDVESYAVAAMVVVMVLVICALLLIPGVRETDEIKNIYIQNYESSEKVSFLNTLKISFKHKNFTTYTIAILIYTIGSGLFTASELYYLNDILGVPYSYALYTVLGSTIAFILTVPIWFYIAKKIGHAQTFYLGVLFFALALIPFIFIMTFIGYFIAYIIIGIGFSALIFIQYAIFAEVNDEVALTMGKRLESTLAGIRTVVFRISIVFQVIIIATVHILTGYRPGATQTDLALWGIRIHGALIPAILCFIAFLILIKWYDLKGEKKERLFSELERKGLK
jgi:GPH family glycoside/pentoside/hexuronide:cation symporter